MMPGFGWNSCCGFGSIGSLGWIGWVINIVVTIGILIALVLLVIWAIRRITNSQSSSKMLSGNHGKGNPTAREILQTRYARGELARDEYQQMLEDIR